LAGKGCGLSQRVLSKFTVEPASVTGTHGD